MAPVRLHDGVLDIAETGAGKPIILLHSLLADRTVFDRIVPLLAAERRVIVPDLPGFGGSSSAGATIEGIADRIAGLFDALGLGNQADVLGNGFGGFVASALAIRHGAKFDRLVLADTGVAFTPEGKQSFYAMADRVRQSGVEAVVDGCSLTISSRRIRRWLPSGAPRWSRPIRNSLPRPAMPLRHWISPRRSAPSATARWWWSANSIPRRRRKCPMCSPGLFRMRS